jgi:predicted membrane channel-forming protein YqfA (hemolysin III family)
MTTNTIDKLIWVLIYGGLLVVCLGVFVRRSADGLGWTLIALGAVVALAGALLVWVRSRMPDPGPQQQEVP